MSREEKAFKRNHYLSHHQRKDASGNQSLCRTFACRSELKHLGRPAAGGPWNKLRKRVGRRRRRRRCWFGPSPQLCSWSKKPEKIQEEFFKFATVIF